MEQSNRVTRFSIIDECPFCHKRHFLGLNVNSMHFSAKICQTAMSTHNTGFEVHFSHFVLHNLLKNYILKHALIKHFNNVNRFHTYLRGKKFSFI